MITNIIILIKCLLNCRVCYSCKQILYFILLIMIIIFVLISKWLGRSAGYRVIYFPCQMNRKFVQIRFIKQMTASWNIFVPNYYVCLRLASHKGSIALRKRYLLRVSSTVLFINLKWKSSFHHLIFDFSKVWVGFALWIILMIRFKYDKLKK